MHLLLKHKWILLIIFMTLVTCIRVEDYLPEQYSDFFGESEDFHIYTRVFQTVRGLSIVTGRFYKPSTTYTQSIQPSFVISTGCSVQPKAITCSTHHQRQLTDMSAPADGSLIGGALWATTYMKGIKQFLTINVAFVSSSDLIQIQVDFNCHTFKFLEEEVSKIEKVFTKFFGCIEDHCLAMISDTYEHSVFLGRTTSLNCDSQLENILARHTPIGMHYIQDDWNNYIYLQFEDLTKKCVRYNAKIFQSEQSDEICYHPHIDLSANYQYYYSPLLPEHPNLDDYFISIGKEIRVFRKELLCPGGYKQVSILNSKTQGIYVCYVGSVLYIESPVILPNTTVFFANTIMCASRKSENGLILKQMRGRVFVSKKTYFNITADISMELLHMYEGDFRAIGLSIRSEQFYMIDTDFTVKDTQLNIGYGVFRYTPVENTTIIVQNSLTIHGCSLSSCDIVILPFARLFSVENEKLWTTLTLMNAASLYGDIEVVSALIGRYSYIDTVLNCELCVIDELTTTISHEVDSISKTGFVDESRINQKLISDDACTSEEFRIKQEDKMDYVYDDDTATLSVDGLQFSPADMPFQLPQDETTPSIGSMSSNNGSTIILMNELISEPVLLEAKIVRIADSEFLDTITVIGHSFFEGVVFHDEVTIHGDVYIEGKGEQKKKKYIEVPVSDVLLTVVNGSLWTGDMINVSLTLLGDTVIYGEDDGVELFESRILCSGICHIYNVHFGLDTVIEVSKNASLTIDSSCSADQPVPLWLSDSAQFSSQSNLFFSVQHVGSSVDLIDNKLYGNWSTSHGRTVVHMPNKEFETMSTLTTELEDNVFYNMKLSYLEVSYPISLHNLTVDVLVVNGCDINLFDCNIRELRVIRSSHIVTYGTCIIGKFNFTSDTVTFKGGGDNPTIHFGTVIFSSAVDMKMSSYYLLTFEMITTFRTFKFFSNFIEFRTVDLQNNAFFEIFGIIRRWDLLKGNGFNCYFKLTHVIIPNIFTIDNYMGHLVPMVFNVTELRILDSEVKVSGEGGVSMENLFLSNSGATFSPSYFMLSKSMIIDSFRFTDVQNFKYQGFKYALEVRIGGETKSLGVYIKGSVSYNPENIDPNDNHLFLSCSGICVLDLDIPEDIKGKWFILPLYTKHDQIIFLKEVFFVPCFYPTSNFTETFFSFKTFEAENCLGDTFSIGRDPDISEKGFTMTEMYDYSESNDKVYIIRSMGSLENWDMQCEGLPCAQIVMIIDENTYFHGVTYTQINLKVDIVVLPGATFKFDYICDDYTMNQLESNDFDSLMTIFGSPTSQIDVQSISSGEIWPIKLVTMGGLTSNYGRYSLLLVFSVEHISIKGGSILTYPAMRHYRCVLFGDLNIDSHITMNLTMTKELWIGSVGDKDINIRYSVLRSSTKMFVLYDTFFSITSVDQDPTLSVFIQSYHSPTLFDCNLVVTQIFTEDRMFFAGTNYFEEATSFNMGGYKVYIAENSITTITSSDLRFNVDYIILPGAVLNFTCLECDVYGSTKDIYNYGDLILHSFIKEASYIKIPLQSIFNFKTVFFSESNIDFETTKVICDKQTIPRPILKFSSANPAIPVVKVLENNPFAISHTLCSSCSIVFNISAFDAPIENIDVSCFPSVAFVDFGEMPISLSTFSVPNNEYPILFSIKYSDNLVLPAGNFRGLNIDCNKLMSDLSLGGKATISTVNANTMTLNYDCSNTSAFITFTEEEVSFINIIGTAFIKADELNSFFAEMDTNVIFKCNFFETTMNDWKSNWIVDTFDLSIDLGGMLSNNEFSFIIRKKVIVSINNMIFDRRFTFLAGEILISGNIPVTLNFINCVTYSNFYISSTQIIDLTFFFDSASYGKPYITEIYSHASLMFYLNDNSETFIKLMETDVQNVDFYFGYNSKLVLIGNQLSINYNNVSEFDAYTRPIVHIFVENVTLSINTPIKHCVFSFNSLKDIFKWSTNSSVVEEVTVNVSSVQYSEFVSNIYYMYNVTFELTHNPNNILMFNMHLMNVTADVSANATTVGLSSFMSIVQFASSEFNFNAVSVSTDIFLTNVSGGAQLFVECDVKSQNFIADELRTYDSYINGSFAGHVHAYGLSELDIQLDDEAYIHYFVKDQLLLTSDSYLFLVCGSCVVANSPDVIVHAYIALDVLNSTVRIALMNPGMELNIDESSECFVRTYYHELTLHPFPDQEAGVFIACAGIKNVKKTYDYSILVICQHHPSVVISDAFILNIASDTLLVQQPKEGVHLYVDADVSTDWIQIVSEETGHSTDISVGSFSPYGILNSCSVEALWFSNVHVTCSGTLLDHHDLTYIVCDIGGCIDPVTVVLSHDRVTFSIDRALYQHFSVVSKDKDLSLSSFSVTQELRYVDVKCPSLLDGSNSINVTFPFPIHSNDTIAYQPVHLKRLSDSAIFEFTNVSIENSTISCVPQLLIGKELYRLVMPKAYKGDDIQLVLNAFSPESVTIEHLGTKLKISGVGVIDTFSNSYKYFLDGIYSNSLITFNNVFVSVSHFSWCPGETKTLLMSGYSISNELLVTRPMETVEFLFENNEVLLTTRSSLYKNCLDISHNGRLDEDSLIVSTTDNLVFKIYFEQAVPGLELTVLGETASEFVPDPTVSSVDRVTAATDNMVLRLSGSGLGGNAVMRHLSVRFGSYDCTISDASETEILCSIEGVGADLQLELTIGTYTESLSQRVSFDPPILKSIVPPLAGCVSDTVAVIRGMNFGIGSVEVTISLPDGSTTTSSLVSASHGLLSVTIPGDPTGECSGFAAVSIRTGGQTSNPLIVAYAVVGSVAPAIVPASETATMLTLDVSNAYAEPVLVLVDDDVSIEITCTYTSYRVTCNTVLNEPRTYTPFLCDGTTELDECEEPSGSVTVFGVEQDRLLTAGSNSEARARFTLVNVDFDFDLRNIDWISTPVVSSLLIEGSVADPYSAVFDYGAGQLPLEPQLLSVGIILQDELVVSGDRFVVSSDYPLDQVSVTLNGTNIYCTSRVVDSTTLHDCVANVDPGDYVVRYTSTEITTSVGLLSVYTVTSIEPQTVFSDKPFEVIITGYNLPEVDDPFCQWTVSHISCISTGISDAQTVVFDWISTPITVDPFPVLDLPAFAYVNTSYDISCSENCDFLVNNTVFTTTTGDKPLVACNNAHCAVFSSITISEPVITSISPLTVSVTSIRPITVAGHSFKPSCVCDISGERETTVVDDSTIICDVPTDVNVYGVNIVCNGIASNMEYFQVSPVLSPYCLAGIPTSLGPIFNAQSVASVRESRCMLQPSDPVKKSSFVFDGATDTVVDGVLVSYFDTCNVPSVNISIGDVSLIVNSDATCDRLPSFATTHKVCAYKVDMFVVSPGMIVDVSVIDGCDATSINSIDLVELQLLQPVSVAITPPTTVRANPGDVSISVSLANIFGAQVTHEYFVDYCKHSYSGILPVFVLPLCRTSSEALTVTAFDSISNVTLKASTVIEPTLGDVFDLSFSSVDVEVWSREAEHVLQFNATDWLGRNVDTSFSTSGSCNGTVLAVSAASIRFNASYEQIRNCSLCASKFCVPLVVNELEYVHRSFDLTVFGVVGPGTIYIEPKNIPPHVRVSELNSTIAHISVIAQNIEVDSIEFMLNMSAQSIPYAISDLAPGSILTFSLLSSNETVAFANATIECPTSTVWSSTTRTCVCDRGTFISSTDPLSCAPCGEGFYQPDIHSAVCFECHGTFTSPLQAQSQAECFCPNGTELHNSVCIKCPVHYICRNGERVGVQAGFYSATSVRPCIDASSCLEVSTLNTTLCSSGRSGYLCHNCDSTRVSRYSECGSVKIGPNTVAGVILLVWCIVCAFIPGVHSVFALSRVAISTGSLFNLLNMDNRWFTVALGDFELDSFVIGDISTIVILPTVLYLAFYRLKHTKHSFRLFRFVFPLVFHFLWSFAMSFPALSISHTLQLFSHNIFVSIMCYLTALSFLLYKKRYEYLSTIVFLLYSSVTLFTYSLRLLITLLIVVSILTFYSVME
ncbi:hypothetical protein PCE1_004655 [Barthelona sp. PCE]